MGAAKKLEMRCRSCGYDLRGLAGRVCPECSQAFDSSDLRTVMTSPVSGLPLAMHAFAGIVLVSMPLVVAFILDSSRRSMPFWFAPFGPILMIGGMALGWRAASRALHEFRRGLPWCVHRWGFIAAMIAGGVPTLLFLGYVIVNLAGRWVR